jgi:hypothetical protein
MADVPVFLNGGVAGEGTASGQSTEWLRTPLSANRVRIPSDRGLIVMVSGRRGMRQTKQRLPLRRLAPVPDRQLGAPSSPLTA